MLKVNYAVRYIFNNSSNSGPVYTFDGDGWFSPDMDGAAAYPWLLNNCIVWIEERVEYEPGDWAPADIDVLFSTFRNPGKYSLDRQLLAEMIAAHTSGMVGSEPEKDDYDIADIWIQLLEAELSRL